MLLTKRIAILAFISLSLSLLTPSCKKDSHSPTPPPPVRVKVLPVANGQSSSSRVYSGTVVSSETTPLSFSVAGRITSLPVTEGQKISRGQLIGKVDASDYENARNIAYAQLAEAQDGYNRLKKLHDANALPDVKWVEMEQKLKQAQNAAEMAERTLRDAELRSPVSGTVSRKLADVGQSVVPVQPVLEIVSTEALEIEVSLSENEIGKVDVGQEAEITFDSPDIAPVRSKVKSKSVVADPLSRAYTVKMSLPSGQKQILPGMLTSVVFSQSPNVSQDSKGVLLPMGTVLLNDDNTWFVWTVKDSTAQRRWVEVDELVPGGVLVTRGLLPGDTVIVEGMQKVGTGSKVIPL